MVADVTGAPLPPLAAIPPDLTSLADYERRAPAHLSPEHWRHIAEGAGEGISLADNRRAFDRWRFLPKAMADLRGGSAAVDLPGGRHATPVIAAPLAYARLAHPDGERAIVQAAAAIGVGTILSTLSSTTLEEVAGAHAQAVRELGAAPSPLWFQLYLQPRRDDSLTLVRRAEAAGYAAIVLTIDAGVKRSGIALPRGIEAANLAGMERLRVTAGAGGGLFDSDLVETAPRWEDLAWLRQATRLPVIVKGMAIGDDIRRLIEMGADALVLSNHGGRVLDGIAASLDVLPTVREVARDWPVLIDGAIRSGADVVKALCLGAGAVLVGRPILYGLAVAGLPGVAHVLQLLRTETEAAMAQLGCRTVADLTPERLLRFA